MPGEAAGVEVDGEVVFHGPEVPGWDRSATVAGVIHGQVLPPGLERVLRGIHVLIKALPSQIPAANASL